MLLHPGLASHLSLDWSHERVGAFLRALAARTRLIRYDLPGTGTADQRWSGFDLERELSTMARVLDASGEPFVALFGRNMSAPISAAFAALHPERVSHLILFGTSFPLLATPECPDGVAPDLADAMERLVLAEWGVGSTAVTHLMLPDATPNEAAAYADYQRTTSSGEAVAAMIREHSRIDVTDLLDRIQAPTLVMHRRDDRTVSLTAARRTAERIPGARFRVLPGSANLPFYGDQSSVIDEIFAFLDPRSSRLTSREIDILTAAAEGRSNRDIAAVLHLSPHTVARHLANIFLKLDVSSRSGAIAAARRAGVLPD
ncbi:MAG: alpha/beta fold hydrolase [Acidimicrobiales bacterium]